MILLRGEMKFLFLNKEDEYYSSLIKVFEKINMERVCVIEFPEDGYSGDRKILFKDIITKQELLMVSGPADLVEEIFDLFAK